MDGPATQEHAAPATGSRLAGDGPDGVARVPARRRPAVVDRSRVLRQVYRVGVGVVGTLVVAVGVVLLPAPGPGWLVIFVGLGVLATEFTWADRLLTFARHQVARWTGWVGRQPVAVRVLVAAAVLALVLAVLWALFAVSGVPGWLPDRVVQRLLLVPGL